MMRNRHEVDAGQVEALAADILSWIATDDTRMSRFLALTGMSVENLRDAARDAGFSLGVLSFLMGHEPTLMVFCDEKDLDPQRIADIWQRLESGQTDDPGA